MRGRRGIARPDFDRAPGQVPELVVAVVREGRALSAVDLSPHGPVATVFARTLIARVSEYDAVLTFAPRPGASRSDGTGDPIFATLWTLIGAPAFSLPLLSGAKGLPIGVQAVGAPGRDPELTRAAAWLMQAAGNSKRRIPRCAS